MRLTATENPLLTLFLRMNRWLLKCTRRFPGLRKNTRKCITQDCIANDSEDEIIEPEELPHVPGQVNAAPAPADDANNLVHALLYRPDAERRIRRVFPWLAIGTKYVFAKRGLHKTRRDHAD